MPITLPHSVPDLSRLAPLWLVQLLADFGTSH